MGVSVRYCAVPPSSTLFSRLESEKAFIVLMKRFFLRGGSIYSLFDEAERIRTLVVDPQVVEDVLSQIPPELQEVARQQVEQIELFLQHRDELAALAGQTFEKDLQALINRHRDVFGPEHEAWRRVAEFRRELERTRSAHIGIDARRCLLEKTYHLIQEGLVRALVGARGTGTSRFVDTLMFGDRKLGRDLGLQAEDRLGLVSPALVREGAQVLQALDASALFAEDGARSLEDFLRWRRLYQAAAAEGEALLAG